MKIKNKLTYLFTLTVGGLLLFFSLTIFYFYSQYRKNEFEDRLKERVILEADLLWKIEHGNLKKMENDGKNLTVLSQEIICIYKNESIIFQSRKNFKPIHLKRIKRIYHQNDCHFQENDLEFYGKRFDINGEKYIILVGAFDQYGFSKMTNLQYILIFGCFVFIIVVLALGRFFAQKALKPIEDIVNQVGNISVSNLSERVLLDDNPEKDEINMLAQAFNKVLARLEYSFEMQKSFVSNASHELRTPLAIVMGQIDVALLKDRNSEEYKVVLHSIYEDLKKHKLFLNRLLDLAQTDVDSSKILFNEKRIDEILMNAIDECQQKYPHSVIVFEFENEPEEEDSLLVNVNEVLLKTAITNVIDNACKYSKSEVNILISFKDVWTILKIIDKGVGIPQEQIEKITEPFYRAANTANFTGHGVGLSLASKIIKLHQGDLQIYSTLNEGTTVLIAIPSVANEKNKNNANL